ncbi:MAG: polysaccharide deacetylase family protein [Ignavibacteriales bacterium]|nr:MAG: polysaccharide deacetylase family protein [Ignavibacteriales bacterium]
MKYSNTPPVIITKLFKEFLWSTSNEKILLTFDDGPTAEATGIILKTLSVKNIKSVFFCVGNNVKNNPSLVREILSEGHLIGNHTFNHKRLTTITNGETKSEIDFFNSLLKDEFNYDVKYFRPPHGRFTISTQSMLSKKNMKCVMWSLLTEDYKNNFETVKFAVENYLKKNSIVVLHDSIKSKEIIKDSINFIIDEADKKRFSFGEPIECLK